MLQIQTIHPMLVHFPIVLVLALVAFDGLAVARSTSISGRTCAANLSTSLAVLAGLFAIAAFTFGDMAFDVALASGVPEARLEMHEELGTAAAIALAVWGALRGFAWWRGLSLEGSRKVAVFAVEAAGLALVIVTAYFGGQLVFDYGVNVLNAPM